MAGVSETMMQKWKDPEFRTKVLKAQKKSIDKMMKKRLLELANGGED